MEDRLAVRAVSDRNETAVPYRSSQFAEVSRIAGPIQRCKAEGDRPHRRASRGVCDRMFAGKLAHGVGALRRAGCRLVANFRRLSIDRNGTDENKLGDAGASRRCGHPSREQPIDQVESVIAGLRRVGEPGNVDDRAHPVEKAFRQITVRRTQGYAARCRLA